MKRLFSGFLFLSLFIPCQTNNYPENIREAMVNMYSQILVFPQEKIYIQTDKPYYMNGEKLFFRAFVVHASTLKPMEVSRYVYVELLSPSRRVVLRQQISLSADRMFYGHLALPEDLPEGSYRLRAYTRYMENLDERFFYTRPVFIADPNATKTELETNFEFIDKDNIRVGLRFRDKKTKEVQSPKGIELQLNDNKSKQLEKPDVEGWFYENFKLKDEDAERALFVDYKDEADSFKKYIRLPFRETLPEISFYPEGGNLIAGELNRVAFKALLPDGSAADIEASLFDSDNEQLVSFGTVHDGMGIFSFEPQAGKNYRVEYTCNGQQAKASLPEVKTGTYALQATWEGDSLSVSVRQPQGMGRSKMYLLFHRNGAPTVFEEWGFSRTEKKWNKSKFATGVHRLLLLASDFSPVSERLVFNNLYDAVEVKIQTGEKTYKRRQHVGMEIRLSGIPADTIPATFAVSVTDDKDVKPDTTTNIMTEILLTFELEGRVNNPAWYFSENEQAFQAADLLMLTHGWRRYNVEQALTGNLQKPTIRPEVSQSFSGILKDKKDKPYKETRIKMSAVGYGHSKTILSDEKGHFIFDGFEFPDSTAYQFVSYTNDNKPDVNIVLDNIQYPSVAVFSDNGNDIAEMWKKDADFEEYIFKANIKYMQENGMRQVLLPEVTVSGVRERRQKERLDNRVTANLLPEKWISSEDIEKEPPSSFEELLYRLPEVTEVDAEGKVIVRGTAASFILNGVPVDDYNVVHVADIAQVDLYTDPVKTLAINYGGIVIAFTTWPPGVRQGADGTSNIRLIQPLGYQVPVEFYSPRYDTPESLNNDTPDLRSTIYWKPDVTVNNNRASVDFYTADSPTTYSVVIEGVTNSRKFIHTREKAIIEVEK